MKHLRLGYILLACVVLGLILPHESDGAVEDVQRQRRRQERRRQQVRALMQSDQPGGLSLYNTFSQGGGGGGGGGGRRRTSSTSTTTTEAASATTPFEETTTASNYYYSRGDQSNDIDDDYSSTEMPDQTTTTTIGLSDGSPRPQDGELRLVGGRTANEGNIQVFHSGEWGSICDDEWDNSEAKIACKQLGFPGSVGPTHSSQFGYTLPKVWMDNMFCYGTEARISDCRFDGWGIHDCERTEAAGVRCHERPPPTLPPPPTTTRKPKTPIRHNFDREFDVRVAGGRVREEGRVEVRPRGATTWSTVCGDGWGIPEAMVVCRTVGMRYAQSAMQTHLFSPASTNGTASLSAWQLEEGGVDTSFSSSSVVHRARPLLTGVSCRGDEDSLFHCRHDVDTFCPGEGARDVAAVTCVEEQADLEPDIYALMSSAHLEDKQMFFLQCAMEENCLAPEAYRLRRERHDYATEMRRLLRFTTSIANVGNADFRPLIPKENWIWHSCHQHYHSMEVFAHFDVLDSSGRRMAEGHKASFCLEDNQCSGVDPKYACANYGDQGITPGCKDIYYFNVDCQWLDVTEMPLGTYTFRMAINPQYKVAEQSFENNAAICTLVYTEQYASIRNCTLTRP